MNFQKKEYFTITNLIINKSFPKLKKTKIKFFEINMGKFSGGVFWLLPNYWIIFINKNVKYESKKTIIGLISHEISHIELYQKKSWLKYWTIIYWKYWINKKYRREIEIETDCYTIEKGYGEELYQKAIIDEKNILKKELKKYYLTSKEIKEIHNKKFTNKIL